jgi:dihydrofolate reductase
MGKLFMFNMISLDGYFARVNGELDWHNVDQEFNEFAIEQLNQTSMLLFGRKTYELMANYWPTPAGTKDDPVVAEKMNNLPKVVFSKSLDKVEWNNSRLIKDNIAKEVTKLKQSEHKDLALFGSANLASSLIQMRLIDEFRIMINPVILGQGKPLFEKIKQQINLKLYKIKSFHNGNTLLYFMIKDN